MKLKDSYIFLSNSKNHKKNNATKNDSITHEKSKNVYDYILNSFPNPFNRESSNSFKQEYVCSIQVDKKYCEVSFVIIRVVDITYLDIVVDGKTKVQIIKCLEQIRNTLLYSGIQDDYIYIISYDSISEYYCNKILPKLNSLERNIRKLLFNIYVLNFGRDFYNEAGSEELQKKAKSIIKAKGNKEIEYLQKFFYSFGFFDIKILLFSPYLKDFEEQERNSFLEKHNDLSKLSDEELRNAFSQFAPKSDWDRFFSSKIDIQDIEDVFDKIRQYRNNIAHFKFFDKDSYTKSNKLIRQLNTALIKAIQLIEDNDFVEKNLEHFHNIMSGVFKIFEEPRKIMPQILNETITSTLQSIKFVYPPILEKIKEFVQYNPFRDLNHNLHGHINKDVLNDDIDE